MCFLLLHASFAKCKKKHILLAQEQDVREVKEKLKALPKTFTAVSCGHGLKNGGSLVHKKVRLAALERLHTQAPKLPLCLEEKWPHVMRWYAGWVAVKHQEACGATFVKEIQSLINALGPHLRCAKKTTTGSVGNADAFKVWVEKLVVVMPKAATTVTF